MQTAKKKTRARRSYSTNLKKLYAKFKTAAEDFIDESKKWESKGGSFGKINARGSGYVSRSSRATLSPGRGRSSAGSKKRGPVARKPVSANLLEAS